MTLRSDSCFKNVQTDAHFFWVHFLPNGNKTETKRKQNGNKTETKASKARKKDLTMSAKSFIFMERETGFEATF